MKLTVLTENMAGGNFLAEHGLAYLIEHEGQKILFDTGHSDVFLQNAHKLGIDIDNEIETVVLSHGHWDHGNGLKYVNNKTLVMHPSAFMKRFRKNSAINIGLAQSKQELAQKFNFITTTDPYGIGKNIFFLGQIPRMTDFEAQSTNFIDEEGNPDFVPDDSALAMIQNHKLLVITGCSHSGICNIIEQARKVTGIDDIEGVIGGFHLKRNDRQTLETVRYLKKQKMSFVYPSHCTELPALAVFHAEFGIQQLKTGMTLEL